MTETTWRNRIVGYGEVNPEELLANPKNMRIHPEQQQDVLEGVLDEVGWVDDIIVNQATGFVVDGHLRVSLALRRDEQAIPVKYVDLTEAEEDLILSTFDPIAAMAAASAEKVRELTEDLVPQSKAVHDLINRIRKEAADTTRWFAEKNIDGEPVMSGPVLAGAVRGDRKGRRMPSAVHLLVKDLKPNDYAPKAMTEKECDTLRRSIEAVGVLQPLIVRPLGSGQYEIVDGNQRWKAAKALEWETIPCRIEKLTKNEARLVSISANRVMGRVIGERMAGTLAAIKKGMPQEDITAATGLNKNYVEAYGKVDHYGHKKDEDGVAVRDYREYGEGDFDPVGDLQILMIPLDPETYKIISEALDGIGSDWSLAIKQVVEEWSNGK